VLDNFGFRQRIELAAGDYSKGDNKSELQEYYRDPSVSISYEIISRSGPDHDPVFEAEIRVEEQGQLLFKERGVGRSKKAAEQAAAGKVLELLRN
jgi:ribonuclease-3